MKNRLSLLKIRTATGVDGLDYNHCYMILEKLKENSL